MLNTCSYNGPLTSFRTEGLSKKNWYRHATRLFQRRTRVPGHSATGLSATSAHLFVVLKMLPLVRLLTRLQKERRSLRSAAPFASSSPASRRCLVFRRSAAVSALLLRSPPPRRHHVVVSSSEGVPQSPLCCSVRLLLAGITSLSRLQKECHSLRSAAPFTSSSPASRRCLVFRRSATVSALLLRSPPPRRHHVVVSSSGGAPQSPLCCSVRLLLAGIPSLSRLQKERHSLRSAAPFTSSSPASRRCLVFRRSATVSALLLRAPPPRRHHVVVLSSEGVPQYPLCCSVRLLLAGIAFIGFALNYGQRIGMSVAIVCMVNQTAVRLLSETNVSGPTGGGDQLTTSMVSQWRCNHF